MPKHTLAVCQSCHYSSEERPEETTSVHEVCAKHNRVSGVLEGDRASVGD